MKIGILTFHNADNYGAVLQCYALQETLKGLRPNDEVRVIDYRNPCIERAYQILCLRRNLPGNLTQFLYAPSVRKKRIMFQTFRREYLRLGSCDLSQYDAIVYGSDQIWNCTLSGSDAAYFGQGYAGKKIAYAASDGGEIKLTDEIEALLRSFSAVSCREDSLRRRLEDALGMEVAVACDPVFLLTRERWMEFAEPPAERNYILAYKIAENDRFDDEAELLGRRLGKKVVQIVYVKSLRRLFRRGQKIMEHVSPRQFVGLFATADFVLTTSFHGTAFSIIFEKPFFVLSFGSRSERITDLLKAAGLEERYGESTTAASMDDLTDMKATENKLADYKKSAVHFLRMSLESRR